MSFGPTAQDFVDYAQSLPEPHDSDSESNSNGYDEDYSSDHSVTYSDHSSDYDSDHPGPFDWDYLYSDHVTTMLSPSEHREVRLDRLRNISFFFYLFFI